MKEHSSVEVTILGKEYRVNCPPSEQDALIKSARYLDQTMREIKGRGTVHGLEKIAVMAALNMAHDLLIQTSMIEESRTGAEQQLRELEDKVDLALTSTRQ